MDIKKAIYSVSKSFKYRADQEVSTKFNGDPWMIMKQDEEGFYKGDCEDFSLTAIYLACNKRKARFLFNVLVTKKYKLYSCKTSTGDRHCIGNFGEYWFDNFSREAIQGRDQFIKTTKHRDLAEHNRLRILYNLYSGWLLQLFGCKKSTSYIAGAILNLTVWSCITFPLIISQDYIMRILN